MNVDREIQGLRRAIAVDPENQSLKDELVLLLSRLGINQLEAMADKNPYDIYIGQALFNVISNSVDINNQHPICSVFYYLRNDGFQERVAFERASLLGLMEVNHPNCNWNFLNAYNEYPQADLDSVDWLKDASARFGLDIINSTIVKLFSLNANDFVSIFSNDQNESTLFYNTNIFEYSFRYMVDKSLLDIIGMDPAEFGLPSEHDSALQEAIFEFDKSLRGKDSDLSGSISHRGGIIRITVSGWRVMITESIIRIQPPIEEYILKNILLNYSLGHHEI